MEIWFDLGAVVILVMFFWLVEKRLRKEHQEEGQNDRIS